jgi:ubiquitin carboxyl-terminal hydrolase 34
LIRSRACLKDIPDNLIFHLKRFDFNLRTMQRSKINDYFSFPHRMDMRPYKVEHLMELPEQTQEDVYELVGILVHAGTAESGHYYSYIRERPSQGQAPNWVEFNDDTVTAFDPTCIEANCFGGPDYRGPDSGGSFQFDKSYSAYMLFYQRSSVLQAQQRELFASSKHPIRLPLARDLSNFIAEENELLIRKYCLYDEGHAPFVLRMLDNVQHINKGRCSEDHALEKAALSTTLNHLDQVVARTKDLPDLGN